MKRVGVLLTLYGWWKEAGCDSSLPFRAGQLRSGRDRGDRIRAALRDAVLEITTTTQISAGARERGR